MFTKRVQCILAVMSVELHIKQIMGLAIIVLQTFYIVLYDAHFCHQFVFGPFLIMAMYRRIVCALSSVSRRCCNDMGPP